jgi:hypothetical protein
VANHTKIPPELQEFHDAGACIERHKQDRKEHCHYDKKGYTETLTAARKPHYNHDGSPSPRGFDPKSVVSLARSFKLRKGKERETTPQQQQPGAPINHKIWDVDGFAKPGMPNFYPRRVGAHYPYRHQWHHLIPSASLRDGLYHDEYGVKPLLCLLVGKYNLNAGENVVLLPEEGQVGQIIRWPTHPTCHPKYNAYTEAKLVDARDKLAAALSDSKEDVHKVDEGNAGKTGTEIVGISRELYRQLEQWGRAGGAGVEINRISEAPSLPPAPDAEAGESAYC